MATVVFREEKKAVTDPWNDVRRIYDVADFWSHVFGTFTPDWIEENLVELTARFKELIFNRAQSLYDERVSIARTYAYTAELAENLNQQNGRRFGYVEEKDFIDPNTGRSHHIIETVEYTNLRWLSGNFQWAFAPKDTVRATDVRYAIRRQLRYLLQQSGVTSVCVDSITANKPKGPDKERALTQTCERVALTLLPRAYPAKYKDRIRRQRFFDAHPEYNIFHDTIWGMYKLVGDIVLEYCDKAVEAGKGKVNEDGIWISPYHNTLHDALYGIAGFSLEDWTPATLRKLLTFQPTTINTFIDTLRNLLAYHNRKLSLKQKRAFIKQLVFSDNPIRTTQDLLGAEREKEEKRIAVTKAATLRKNGITEDLLSVFAERMNHYAPDLSGYDVVKAFGPVAGGKMLRGEYEGLFKSEEILMPMKFLGDSISHALGKRGVTPGLVKNSNRLYHHLSKHGNVHEMIQGNIDKPAEVLSTLRRFLPEGSLPKECEQATQLRAVVEPKCSPEFLVAGNASVCCMSFGANNAKQYAKYKGFGVLNIYLANRIVGNSVIWINQMKVGRVLVLDNCEIHPNYTRFNSYIYDLYYKTIAHLMEEYDCLATVQGSSYNDLQLAQIEHSLSKFEWNIHAVDVPINSFYTDAYHVSVVATKQSAAEMKKWEREMKKAGAVQVVPRPRQREFTGDWVQVEAPQAVNAAPVQPGPFHAPQLVEFADDFPF